MATFLLAPPPRNRRTLLTVVGSVVLHGSIIAVAALWPVHDKPPAPAEVPLVTQFIPQDPPLSLPPAESNVQPPEDVSEPVPPVTDEQTDTPPTEMTEEMTLTPPRAAPKTVVNRTHAAHSPPNTTPHAQPGTPGSGTEARTAIGAAGVGIPGAAGRWNVSQPAYPATARAMHIQGSGRVRITTDGTGRVVSVSVVQSTGNAVLDFNTSSYARTNWSGPPNASTTVPITYQLR